MPPDTSDLADARRFRGRETPEGDRSRMSFLEHLDELRRRILYSLYALVARLRGVVLVLGPAVPRT